MPSPLPESTATVYVVPEPETAPRLAPVTPAVTSWKSPASTPVTALEKVTV